MPPSLRTRRGDLSSSENRRGRNPDRRRRALAALEACEDRTLLATAFGVTTASALIRFDTATPGTIASTQPITGLGAGETVLGLDFRPANGQLFALGSTSRLYTIDYASNPATAAATPVGSPALFTIAGNEFGFDFNPTVDRIRVVSDTNQNLRLDPNVGTLTATDTPLAYAAADVNAGADPDVVGSAYTNSVNGATTTTLYGIDVARSPDVLVTQNPPNAGTLNTVGSLGVNATAVLGFDIQDTTNTAFATLVVGGTPGLYQINLTTGAATLVGAIGGQAVRGLAIVPQGFSNTTLAGTTATFNGGPAADSITFDQSGGLLRHNRFSAGDTGFNSDFDFDPNTAGDQTLSATDPAVTIIVNAGGSDDRVRIGSSGAPASGLAANFQVNGQGGGDTLTVDDIADGTGRTVTINGATSAITGLGGPITYSGLEGLTLAAGGGGDRINVLGTSAALTNINAGGGDDTVAFGNGASLSGGFVIGGPGTNTLDYSAYTTPVTVDLSAAQTQTLFQAILSGAQEAGPLSNSPASGTLFGLLNAAQTAFAFNIAYQGLTGSPISGTHFHNQVVGVSGPIVRGLFPSEQNGLVTPSGTFQGVWSNSDPTLTPPDPAAPGAPVRPLNAPSPVTPGSTLVNELLSGRIYFNIHTLPNFPSGEVRGQLFSQGTVNPATGTAGVRGFSNVTGGSGADALTGDANVNVLRGGPGNDVIVGGQAGDQLFGDADDDTIIWNNGDGSDFMEGGLGNDTVQVNGSPTGADQFLIQVNPADASRLRFDRTNLGLFNLNIGTTEALDFNTLDGDDTLTVDFAGGNPIPVGFGTTSGIDFDGGTGADLLVLQRSAGSFVASDESYHAVAAGAGDISFDGRTIRFSNLQPVNDTVPVTNFTFTAPAGSTTINVVNGPTVSGFPTTQINDGGTATFELINFANKANATINSGSGPQTIVLNNSTTPTGLVTMTINGDGGADQVSVVATPPSVATVVNTLGGNDAVNVTGTGVPGGATILLDGGPGTDVLNYDAAGGTVSVTPGPLPGQATINRMGSGAVIFQNFEQVNIINAAPPATVVIVVAPAPPLQAVEGRPLIDVPVAQFVADPAADPDQYDATINWGDGSLPSAGTVASDPVTPGRFIVTGSHTYDASGTFTTTVTVRDRGQTTTTFVGFTPVTITTQPAAPATAPGATITVADASLQAQGADISGLEGQTTGSVTVATFLDNGGVDAGITYTATVAWGDGTTTSGATITPVGTSPAGTTYRVDSSHTYAREGTFPITVTITSSAGSAAIASGRALIADGLVPVGAARTVSATVGTPANSLIVAAFADAGLPGPVSDYSVVINWGDGSATGPGLVFPSGNDFVVRGAHTFSRPGVFPGSVTVHSAGGATLTIPFTAFSNPIGITCIPVSATEDRALNNVVLALISPAGGPSLAPNFYTATIDFGDGTAPSRGTIDSVGRVRGSHTYAESGLYTIRITIGTAGNPNLVVGTCPQTVADRPIVLTGTLDAASDTGVSSSDRITNDNTPTFFGTSEPGSVVRIFLNTSGGGRLFVGSAVTDASGAWRATSVRLPDGTANFTAEATDRNGVTRASIGLGQLVIDTVGPRVTDLIFDRLTGRIGVAFQDDRSGLDQRSLIDGANYRFSGMSLIGPRRNGPFLVTSIQTTGSTGPTTAQGVELTINNGQEIRGGTFRFTILSGGVEDVAGNALDGEFYGFFPSGNRRPGGDFVAQLDSFHLIARAPKPIENGFATPIDPPGRPAQGFVIGRGSNQFVAATSTTVGKAHPTGPKASGVVAARSTTRTRPATKG